MSEEDRAWAQSKVVFGSMDAEQWELNARAATELSVAWHRKCTAAEARIAELEARVAETEAFASEGWAWLDVALTALGVKTVFDIPVPSGESE